MNVAVWRSRSELLTAACQADLPFTLGKSALLVSSQEVANPPLVSCRKIVKGVFVYHASQAINIVRRICTLPRTASVKESSSCLSVDVTVVKAQRQW
jgi:hypothetical protein